MGGTRRCCRRVRERDPHTVRAMMKLPHIRPSYFLAAALSLACVGCTGVGAFNYQSNDQIPGSIRTEIAEARDRFLTAIREGDREGVKASLVETARAQIETSMGMDRFLLVTKEMIEPGSMAVVEEHYIRGKSVGVFNPVLVISEPEPHTFVLPQVSSDAYLLLLSFDQSYRKTAMGLLLVEHGAAWKVLTVYAGGMFSVGGRPRAAGSRRRGRSTRRRS